MTDDLERWAYAAFQTDERPRRGSRFWRSGEPKDKHKHPADMAFRTLIGRFYDEGEGRNWVFPLDLHALGLIGRWGGLTKAEREERKMH